MWLRVPWFNASHVNNGIINEVYVFVLNVRLTIVASPTLAGSVVAIFPSCAHMVCAALAIHSVLADHASRVGRTELRVSDTAAPRQ